MIVDIKRSIHIFVVQIMDNPNKADTKSPPANPRIYIYGYYNIDPKKGLEYVRKYVKKTLK